ncbi:AEX-3 domain-containing protein [Crucibulum laeve]|uniref:AEX-3 domain-containing protein n=1 Tax=Crucibulum laeve TaxID=68775 RepID=A0A5C3M774_9AGAR|nr:AEX-3 domain-containing protein [Crucibulum laeve]
MASGRKPAPPATAVSASPFLADRDSSLKSRYYEQSLLDSKSARSISQASKVSRKASSTSSRLEPKKDTAAATAAAGRSSTSGTPIINISLQHNPNPPLYPDNDIAPPNSNTNPSSSTASIPHDPALADELDYITVTAPEITSPSALLSQRTDKASRILGIKHRRSMEPIPASARNSIVSTRSARDAPPIASFVPTLPLTSLYVVSGLPKSPHTWTLADPDSVLGLHHSEGAVSRWWRPEVLGSTVSPGAGGGKKKKRGKAEEIMKGAGALSKQEVGKMLSKALKLSFTREVEVIASTLQPASTIHTFTFTLPAPSTPLAPTPSGDLLRASVLSTTDNRSSAATFAYPYNDDPFARPSSAYLGPPSLLGHAGHNSASAVSGAHTNEMAQSNTVTYHGVCLTVWSHADAERSSAIRRTLEAGRSRKESAQSIVASRLKNLRTDMSGSTSDIQDPTVQARRSAKKSARGPWADAETDAETEADGAMSESDFEVASTIGHGPGESTLFLPGDTVFWLPYALTLVSRHPVYDLMRDYLTLSWARFSKDVQSHTLQISKILAHPAPRAGDLIKLDASPKSEGGESSLEVIARFPGGLDFGRGLVDINFTMWPLFKCLNIDNILTICEIALAPTGRILFFSRYPAMLGIAVSTIKYLVELRGWNGIALPAVHSRDAKIYIDDPGPWIMGLATEARYSIRPSPEVCICDLDINYLNCPSPPPGVVSTKQQRDKYRQKLLAAFEVHYHPDHSIPSEFKEAFPAGRFRPVCKIQAKRGASSAAVADQIKPPEWWHSTRIIQAFDTVLQDKFKKPSLLKRISMFGATKRAPQLTAAEQLIQHSIRKRATAFVDARDDLETKIGRLSRRLNFLMTESDLWRDKFVTFEQYAEKLSAEAHQLRTKINKEQRETKRLSGLVTLTAAEKSKLQNQLKDTEQAHQEAMLELDRMKETMDKMEQERAEMVAEVEAQIERALASMAVDIDESDYASSRPQSRMSNMSDSRSRRASDASKTRPLRSFGTESTLAEAYSEHEEQPVSSQARGTETIEEDEEEDTTIAAPKKKRFSASEVDLPQDGMNAVDEGISQKSDKIAQKVLEIQQKLETALATDRRGPKWRPHSSAQESGEDSLSEATTTRPRISKGSRPRSKQGLKTRARSGTASSAQTQMTTIQTHPESIDTSSLSYSKSVEPATAEASSETPTRNQFPAEDESTSHPVALRQPSISDRPVSPTQSAPPTPALTTGAAPTTDDSDTDFQSAYSASPRGSYLDHGDQAADAMVLGELHENLRKHPLTSKSGRNRISSTGTAIASRDYVEPSPTFSDDTIMSRNRNTALAASS